MGHFLCRKLAIGIPVVARPACPAAPRNLRPAALYSTGQAVPGEWFLPLCARKLWDAGLVLYSVFLELIDPEIKRGWLENPLEMKVSIRKSSVNMTDFPFPCWRTRGSVKTWGFWRLRGQSTNIPLLPKLFQFQIWINLDIFYWITRSKDIWKVIPHYCYCKYDFTFLSFLGVAVPPGTRSPSRTARSAAWSLPAWRWQAGTFLWWLKQRWSRHFNNCKSSILSLNFCLVTLVTWCIMMILPPKMVSEKFGTCHIAKHGLSMHKHGLSMGWWAPMASILVPQRSTKWDGRVGNGCLLRISTSRSPDNR